VTATGSGLGIEITALIHSIIEKAAEEAARHLEDDATNWTCMEQCRSAKENPKNIHRPARANGRASRSFPLNDVIFFAATFLWFHSRW